MKHGTKIFSFSICYALILQLAVIDAAAQQAAPLPTALNIVVVEGEGALNNVTQRAAHEPVVRVEDENNRPIAGATVLFALPTEGPSGDFGGSKTLTVTTDRQGLATAHPLRLNQNPGKLIFLVSASYKGLTARTSITQVDMLPAGAKASGGGGGKWVLILALAGAAAAGGAYAATHGGNSNTQPGNPATAPIGITPGTVSVGPPH